MDEWLDSLSGKGVAGRAEVMQLTRHNTGKALAVARAIRHPWYRCQAITSIIETNRSHPDAEALLAESFAAAYSQREPNRIVSVAFWPLHLLVGYNVDSAATHTGKLLGIIAQEQHGLRRLHGLSFILSAIVEVERIRAVALPPFLETASTSHGWRTERIIDHIARVLTPFDQESAITLLASRPVTRYTRKSRALLGPPCSTSHAGA